MVDEVSFSFVKGATVDFTEELIRASFSVRLGPDFLLRIVPDFEDAHKVFLHVLRFVTSFGERIRELSAYTISIGCVILSSLFSLSYRQLIFCQCSWWGYCRLQLIPMRHLRVVAEVLSLQKALDQLKTLWKQQMLFKLSLRSRSHDQNLSS